jgi:hypothetical protein
VERNRSHLESRGLIRFDATAEHTWLPAVCQAARLTRHLDRSPAKIKALEQEWRITSRPLAAMSAEAMCLADRRYWAIENGLRLRLDVTAHEGLSWVRLPVAVLNLAMVRGATVSLAVHWMSRCSHSRQATFRGFYDFTAARNSRNAFAPVSASKYSWLPQ